MRRSSVEGFDGHPTVRHWQFVEMRDHQQRGDEGRRRYRMSHDAGEPRHVPMAVRRNINVAVVVSREMSMDRCVRVMRIGLVPVLLRQSRRQGYARDERKPDDRRAQLPEHDVIMAA